MARKSGIFSREIVFCCDPRLVPQARSEAPDQEPGDVHRRDRKRGHDDHLLPRAGTRRHGNLWFVGTIAFWLWLTVLFANFAEAIAEGRGKAQANALRETARRPSRTAGWTGGSRRPGPRLAEGRHRGRPGREVIPADGEIIEGRRHGRRVGHHRRVRARHPRGRRRPVGCHRRHGASLGSLVITVTQEPGKSFLDRMIALVEGAERRKTPNEIALNILLAGLTITFLARRRDAEAVRGLRRHAGSQTVLIALLVA